MEKISPIQFSAKWEKRLLLFNFSSKTPSVRLSEIHVPQEYNLGTTVGKCVSFSFGPQRRFRKDWSNSRERNKIDRWPFVCLRLVAVGLCHPSAGVCWGSEGAYKLFILKPVFFLLPFKNFTKFLKSNKHTVKGTHLSEFLPMYTPLQPLVIKAQDNPHTRQCPSGPSSPQNPSPSHW